MAVGANNVLDKRLVELYSDKQTICQESNSTIAPEQVWDSMKIIAMNNQAIMSVKYKNLTKVNIG